MGACDSKAASGGVRAAKPKAKKAPRERQKLDIADYTFSKRTDEVLIKQEGSIDGQQFNIEE